MKRRYLLSFAFALLFAPAGWVIASDLWTGWIAPGGDTVARQEAQAILLRRVLQGQIRTLEAKSRELKARAQPANDMAAMRIAVPSRLEKEPPTCPEYVIRSDKPKIEWAGTLSHLGMQSLPIRVPLRSMFVEDARFLALEQDLSVFQLAVLDACFQASPFSNSCNNWLQKREPTRDEILEMLLKRGWVTQRSGHYCWVTPEFQFPE